MTVKDSFPKQDVFIDNDAIDDYFECITACSIGNEGMQCITQCVEVHLKNEIEQWLSKIFFLISSKGGKITYFNWDSGQRIYQSSSRNNCIYSGDLHTAKLSLDNLEGTNNILLTAN